MEKSGIVRCPGSLDPRAQEFRPRNPTNLNPPPLHVFYSYASPYPPISELQVFPFYDGAGYPQFQFPPPYVTQVSVPPPARPTPQSPSAATRSLLLTSVPSEVSESAVRRELEVFGEVRAVEMERVNDGIVTVHFYDLRNAEMAFREIREQHMQQQTRLHHYHTSIMLRNSLPPLPPSPPPARGLISGRAVWAQFVTPASNAVPEGRNQGTIIVFNLDTDVSTSILREIFEVFGPVKELRETPLKKNQRFVEFFDIRDAAKALKEMNGKEVAGKPLLIEFSQPGGHNRNLFNGISSSPTIYRNSNSTYPKTPKFSPPAHPMHHAEKRLSHHSKSRSNEALMASLNLNDDSASRVEEGLELSGQPLKTNSKKVISSAITESSKLSEPQTSRSKMRKGRQPKKFDSRFLINEDQMVESEYRDSRTTVMIKNIPNKYSQKLLLNMLDNHCIHCNEQIGEVEEEEQPLSSYDFVYLPIDFNNKCNVGYGFVNMTSPEATWRLYKAFHFQHWEVFNSRKICQVTYARVQGLEALKDHFKNSKFHCEMDHYLPVVFSPPRDGRHLTEPLPVAGQRPFINVGDSSEEAGEMDVPDTPENPDYNHSDLLTSCSFGGRSGCISGDDDYGNDEDC